MRCSNNFFSSYMRERETRVPFLFNIAAPLKEYRMGGKTYNIKESKPAIVLMRVYSNIIPNLIVYLLFISLFPLFLFLSNNMVCAGNFCGSFTALCKSFTMHNGMLSQLIKFSLWDSISLYSGELVGISCSDIRALLSPR